MYFILITFSEKWNFLFPWSLVIKIGKIHKRTHGVSCIRVSFWGVLRSPLIVWRGRPFSHKVSQFLARAAGLYTFEYFNFTRYRAEHLGLLIKLLIMWEFPCYIYWGKFRFSGASPIDIYISYILFTWRNLKVWGYTTSFWTYGNCLILLVDLSSFIDNICGEFFLPQDMNLSDLGSSWSKSTLMVMIKY